jgi:hypothetical protein
MGQLLCKQEKSLDATHNGYTVVVNVCLLVKLFLDLGVFTLGLDTAGVKSGLVDAGNHLE